MNELVFKSEKGNPVTTSLLVAEKFGKNHKDVLKAVRNLDCSDEFHKRNFAPMFYINDIGNGATRKDPYTIMTRDGFVFLAMGFTGSKAAKFKEDFIEAFNKMEQAIKTGGFQIPTSFKEALLLAAEQQDVIEAQGRLLESQKPAVTFMNAVTGSTTNILVRDMAKLLIQNGIDTGEERLYEWLVQNKYLIRVKRWSNKKQTYINDYTPTQRAAELKIFFVSEQTITVGGELIPETQREGNTKRTGLLYQQISQKDRVMKLDRQFYKIKDVAQIMGLSTKTIRRKIHCGRIKAIKNDGFTGEYLIPAEELNGFIKSLGV